MPAAHAGAQAALAELAQLFRYLDAMGGLGCVQLDLSLARGLDYYTGVIYEAVTLDAAVGVGSIAAGGRYDELVGMFKSRPVPCVGVSIGVARVFTIRAAKAKAAAAAAAAATATAAAAAGAGAAGAGAAGAPAAGMLKRSPVQVLVASIPSTRGAHDMAVERLRACDELWRAGISAETAMSAGDPKLKPQMGEALERGVPLLVILAEDELDRGDVKLKLLATRDEAVVRRSSLADEVRARLGLGLGLGGAHAQPPRPQAASDGARAPEAMAAAPKGLHEGLRVVRTAGGGTVIVPR